MFISLIIYLSISSCIHLVIHLLSQNKLGKQTPLRYNDLAAVQRSIEVWSPHKNFKPIIEVY